MRKGLFGIVGVLCVTAIVVLALSGCDTGTTTGSLIVTPSYVVMSDSTNSVSIMLTVVTSTNYGGGEFSGQLYEWRVDDATLGGVYHSAGNQAMYVRTAKNGEQYVYVKDAYMREGWAVIVQE